MLQRPVYVSLTMKTMIQSATNLPSIPKVVQELIASLNNPNFSSNQIGQIVANDLLSNLLSNKSQSLESVFRSLTSGAETPINA